MSKAGWLKDVAVIDYETLPIGDRPRHPPAPVGVALKIPGQKARYLAWGHPSGNNCSWGEARRALGQLYLSGRPLLFHNAKFDVEVGEVHMGLERLPWDRYHDTLPALFLMDPRAEDFGLKTSAERLLGQKPEERDAIVEWLVERQPVHGIKLSRAPKSDHYAGAYVAYAPPSLVGPYACGDVDRTFDVAVKVFNDLERRNMMEAYDRERKLMLLIMKMEQQGLRVHLDRLERDVAAYEAEMVKLETWVRRRLKASDDLNLDSGQQLARALIAAGVAKEADFGVTEKTGAMQTNKAALEAAVKDPQILSMLRHRAQLTTCLNTFMKPWLEVARERDHRGVNGFIYTEWHSTRRDRGGDGVGARTGRFSSTPNFGNIPNEFKPHFQGMISVGVANFRDANLRGYRADNRPSDVAKRTSALDKHLPKMPYQLLELPKVRSYVAPYEKGDVLLDRDYSQQEPRILAHFESGPLMQAYKQDPWIDFHDTVQKQLAEAGLVLERKKVKGVNLGLMYGMGVGHLAEILERSVDETKHIKAQIMRLYPGLRDLYDEAKRRAETNRPIRTWGGREYYCEPPSYSERFKRVMTYDYKLPNCLIQGSAADCTKQAMLNFSDEAKPTWRLLLSVHDQLTVSAPKREMHQAMECLRDCMERVQFDVEMKSEGSWSDDNWEDLVDYDKKGQRVKEAA